MPSAKTARSSPDSTRPAKRARLSNSHKKMLVDAAADLPPQLGNSAKVPKFLRSLYAILQTEDRQILSWVQNRELKPNSVTSFHILEMERFECEVLPKYFKHQKFASFQRQLNNFGFRKWTKTQSSGVCTFSHNCFPPDLSAPSKNNMSLRDQWRQKSTQVIPPPASAMSQSKRRVVGNSIAKSKANTSRHRPGVHVQVRDMGDSSPFSELYRSPNSSASMESSGFRHTLSHQPALKKLARPNGVKHETESLNGLEAFCEDSFKFILPPLQPHHLLSTTPRNAAPPVAMTPSFSNRRDSNAAPALSGFRYSLANSNNVSSSFSMDSGLTGYKPFDFKHVETQSQPYTGHQSNAADAAALQGAFLEPWMLDAQVASSGLELSTFPLEFDCKNDFDWQEGSGSSNYQVAAVMPASSAAMNSSMSTKELCHQQDHSVPSNSEEFGLENLLFAE